MKQGVHSYRRYQYQAGYTFSLRSFRLMPLRSSRTCPTVTVFRTDNRSRYDGFLSICRATFRGVQSGCELYAFER